MKDWNRLGFWMLSWLSCLSCKDRILFLFGLNKCAFIR
jgi:hypothetical protein